MTTKLSDNNKFNQPFCTRAVFTVLFLARLSEGSKLYWNKDSSSKILYTSPILVTYDLEQLFIKPVA